MATEVEATDVIKLILQFCAENSLTHTMKALQEESGVALNTVESVEGFVSDINNGHWDSVLRQALSLKLPTAKLVNLYEQVMLEMLELREIETARSLLRNTEAMQTLKGSDWERYRRLEDLVARTYFDPRDAYGDSSKERRRGQLASSLVVEVSEVPASRLLSLVGQALKWQQNQGQLPPGTAFDLFRGTAPLVQDEEEAPPAQETRAIKFTKKSHPESAYFTPDGQHLITGSVDGFMEVWNYSTGRLNKDLQYQKDEKFMMHSESVLCMASSRDSEMLATGSQDGQIKVWRLRTGQLLRRYDKAHSHGITTLCFSRDGQGLLSGSFDTTLRIHGLKSGRMLKEFRGHTSYVNSGIYTADIVAATQQIVSGSSDGTVKVWDARSSECMFTFSPHLGTSMVKGVSKEVPVNTVLSMPQNVEQIVVCNRSPTVYILTLKGTLVRSFSSGKAEGTGGDFVSACTSPKGEFIYCLAEDGVLYCFSQESGKLEKILTVHDKEPIGLAHHPHRNMVVTYSEDGPLKVWTPA